MKLRNSDMKRSRHLGLLAVACAILVLTPALCSATLRPAAHLQRRHGGAPEAVAEAQTPPSPSALSITTPGRLTPHQGHGCCCGAAAKQAVRKDEPGSLARLLVTPLATLPPNAMAADSSEPEQVGHGGSFSQPAAPTLAAPPLRI